jgi:hypothetical protein
MAHSRGGFKANSASTGRAVKKKLFGSALLPPMKPIDQNTCKKFSQFLAAA